MSDCNGLTAMMMGTLLDSRVVTPVEFQRSHKA